MQEHKKIDVKTFRRFFYAATYGAPCKPAGCRPFGATEKRKYNFFHWQKAKFIWFKKADKVSF
jgi:hypothetical protein